MGWGLALMCTVGTGCCHGGNHVLNSIAFIAGKNGNACADYPSSSIAVARGAWNHVAVTVAPLAGGGKTISFYIDGWGAV